MRQILISGVAFAISVAWFFNSGFSFPYAAIFGLLTTYLPFYFNRCERKDGFLWPMFQRLKIWKKITNYNKGTVKIECQLDGSQQYIFCCFPHGAGLVF
jgi:hypothetical protein